jgi:hypothetical protein
VIILEVEILYSYSITMALDNERALENSWESLPKDQLYKELSRYAAS